MQQRDGSAAVLQSRLSQHLWRAAVDKLLTCVHESVSSSVGRGGPASAQPHALLLAHVGAHKEGFQLSFPLDVDESSTLAPVAQLLQHVGRFLCDLEVDKQNSIFLCRVDLKPHLETQVKLHSPESIVRTSLQQTEYMY